MHLSIRTLNVACLAGFLALVLGGLVVVASAARAKANRIEHSNKVADSLLGGLMEAQSTLSLLDAILMENQAAAEKVSKKLPESEVIGGFLADLDALASKADVKINKVTSGQPVAEEVYTRTPITFSCDGSFAELHSLLYRLERMDRLVRVEQISISRRSPSSRCSMNVLCSVYGR